MSLIIIIIVLVIVLVFWHCSSTTEGFSQELANARLLTSVLHKNKEMVSEECTIPVPSGYVSGPLHFKLQKQQGQGWAVYLIEIPFNISGRQEIFKALLDTGSDHLVLLGKECSCSDIYKLYPPVGKTTPSSCDIKNRYGDGTEYLSGRKEGIIDIYSGIKFTFNYVKKLISRSKTGSQVYPICGLSVGQSPNFMDQILKSLSTNVPRTLRIDFPSQRVSIGEEMDSDVKVPVASESEYKSLGLPYLFFYLISPKSIQYQDSQGTWRTLKIDYVIPDTGSVSFAVGPSFMKNLDIKAMKIIFQDSITGKEHVLDGPVHPGQATPLIEHDNVLLVPVGFLDKSILSLDFDSMVLGLS